MILTFTVSLPQHFANDEPWQATLEIDESTTLEDFHGVIQQAVDFDDDHLFSFYLAKSERSRQRTWFDDEYGGLDQTLGELFPLAKGFRLFYLFDFGDEWLFKITKSRKKPRAPEPNVAYPRLVKEVGIKPIQYPEWDEDEYETSEMLDELIDKLPNIDTEDFILDPVPLPDVQSVFNLPIMQTHSLGMYEIAGFTLAAISAPQNIPFSEWSPHVFKDSKLPKFTSIDETEKAMSGLTTLWNHWAETIGDSFGLPPECSVDEDNYPSEALQCFCDGYFLAQDWLNALWDDLVFEDIIMSDPEEESFEEDDMDALGIFMKHTLVLDSCFYFSSPDNNDFLDDDDIEDLIDFNVLPALMLDIALFGRNFGIENIKNTPVSPFSTGEDTPQIPPPFFTPPEPYENPNKIGRNDPCPCGSGKKFKKCCLH